MVFDSVHEAVDFIEQVKHQPDAFDPGTLRQSLRDFDAYAQHVLTTKSKNAEARKQVESGTVTYAGRTEKLTTTDIKQTIMLSDTFNLDEIQCIRLMILSGQQRGVASAAFAAVIYMEERRAQVACLWYLLQSQSMPDDTAPEDVRQVLYQYTTALLRQEQNGKRSILNHLLRLIKEKQADLSVMTTIVDEQGTDVSLAGCLATERTSLCQCVVYGCQTEPCLPEGDVVAIAQQLLEMGNEFHGVPGQEVPTDKQAAFQHTYTLLVAFLAVILPPVISEGVEDEPPTDHERAISNLANSSELKRLLEGGDEVTSGFHAIAKLAWGVMLRIIEEDNHQTEGRAAKCIHVACEWGVFRFLTGSVLGCYTFMDEQPSQKEAYSTAMHKLVIQFLNAARSTEVPSLLARSKEETSIRQPQRQHPDSLASLLHCLASLYKLHPDLWLDASINIPQAWSNYGWASIYHSVAMTIHNNNHGADWALLHDYQKAFGCRPDIVIPFMDYLRDQSVVAESAPLLVAWLDLLTGMASGEEGASTVFGSLLTDAAGKQNPVSWLRMLGVIREYCIRYGHQPEEEEQEPGRSRQDCLVPPDDVAGMSAFLKLFSQVMRDAADGQVVSWMRTLEEESSIVPLWEVMFQLMCHPVPQTLKAACDEAISVMVARGGQAGAMWERLLAAVVVMPDSQDDAAVSQYDISYQLNEIEARSEDFSETLAFVRLLNTLWKASGPSIHDGGRPYAHFTQYVLHTILAPINQRRYKDNKQKWELFAACLQHLRLVVQALRPGTVQAHAGTQAAVPPGLTIMLDLLRDGTSLAACSHLIEEGVTKLLEARGSPAGAAHEKTLLAGLRFLNTALETDVWLLQELRQHPATGQYTESLDAVLKHDSRRIAKLISCVGYTSNSFVQLEAIKLTRVFAARQPHLVEMLVQQRVKVTPDGKHVFPPSATWQRIRFAFAGCLQEAFGGQNTPLQEEEDQISAPAGQDDGPDPRAVLIMQLLLSSLRSSNLNLSYMLMGFDVTKGVDGVYNSQLDPQQGFSCLSVVLNLALAPGLSQQQPLLYEQSLQLLYRLSEQLQTRDAMLTLLRQASYSMLISRIGEVLPVDDFEPKQGPTHSARLYQAAWLLHLAALELHHADLAVQDTSCNAILAAYFTPENADDQETDELAAGASSFVIMLLYFFGTATTQQPQYVIELSSSVRQSLRDMAVDALLQSTTPVSKGGVLTASSRGQMCYDLGALTHELQRRYQVTAADNLRYSGDSAEGTDDLRDACRQALRFAQRYNAWLEEAAALLALVQAWQQLVAVAVTKRFNILHTIASASSQEAGQEAGLKVVQQLLMESLPVLHDLLQPHGHSLVLPVAQVVEACMARMQEQVLNGGLDGNSDAQLLAGGLVPAVTVQLLHNLLAVLDKGQSESSLRPHLYAALLSFMQYSQGPRPAQASPHILKALLQAGHANGNSSRLVANMDDQAREVEEGVSAALANNLSLLSVVIRDAAASSETISPAMKAQALTLLATWVVADSSHSVAGRIRKQELPARILEDLVNRAHVFLPGPHGQMAVQVIEAQLTLLLRLSSATQASGLASDSLQAISKLIHCKVIDFEPEEPVQRGDRQHQSSRRKRITRVLVLVLQVVNSELAWQQTRSETRSQAVSFVAQHCRMMQRVLREAAVGNLNGWKPGEQEAELATLVLSLVTQLPFGQLSQQPGAPADAIREGTHRLLQPFSCATEDSHSPLVHPPVDDASDGPQAPSGSLALKVVRLKCALARYLVWEVNASPDFRYQVRPSPSLPSQPCLLQLATMLKQAAKDREGVNAERQELLDAIQSGSTSRQSQQLALQVHGSRASKQSGNMSSLLVLAAQKERQLQQTCLLLELVLAVVLKHLSEAHDDADALSRLGDSRAFAALQRMLDPTLDYLMRPSRAFRHAESTEQMARELQNYLSKSIAV